MTEFVAEHDERFGQVVENDNITLKNSSDGYCMVFQRITPHFELKIEGNKLVTFIRNDIPEKDREHVKQFPHFHNIVELLPLAKIKYSLKYSTDPKVSWVFCVFSIDSDVAEAYAAKREVQVLLNPREAIKHGRHFRDFNLAHRTWLEDGSDDPEFTDENGDNYPKLSIELWKYTHIAYSHEIPRAVYKTYPPTNSVLDTRLFLRILYDILTDERKIGGAQFRLTAYMNNSNHPLKQFFALPSERQYRPEMRKDELMRPHRNTFWNEKIDDLRNYYGEAHTFYFAYILHYTNWLYALAVFGIILFIIQLGESKIDVSLSTIYVLISLIWSTLMIETWYRREWLLSHKWGTMKYQQTEIPRPNFRGVIKVSEANGDLVEDHKSKLFYYIKMVFSLSTILVTVVCVIVVVFGIWYLKAIWGNKTKYSISIGIINAVQIQIMNKLYTYLAFILNEYEGHRLELDYYNHLVVKRILFLIINSFNSLFYLAFYYDKYPSRENCLDAVRTQLLTLFFTALVITNLTDFTIPIVYTYVIDKLTVYQENKFLKNNDGQSAQVADATTQQIELNVSNESNGNEKNSNEDDEENKMDSIKSDEAYKPFPVSEEMWKEIESQLDLSPSPDVLYSTSESIITYGYIMLFSFVFPLMPLLSILTEYFQLRVDYYNVVTCQRPVPLAANGIGVWKHVLAAFSITAIFTNSALLTFKTAVITTLMGTTQIKYQIIFFFLSSIILLFVSFVIRFAIPDIPDTVGNAIEREELCEKYLLLDTANIMAEEMAKSKTKLNDNNSNNQ